MSANIVGVTFIAKLKSSGSTGNAGRKLVLSVNGTTNITLNVVDALGGMDSGTPPDPNNAAAGIQLGTQFMLAVSATSDVKTSELLDIILLVQYTLKSGG